MIFIHRVVLTTTRRISLLFACGHFLLEFGKAGLKDDHGNQSYVQNKPMTTHKKQRKTKTTCVKTIKNNI